MGVNPVLIKLFLIGNSLTWDLYSGLEQHTEMVDRGAHIKTNSTILEVVNSPPEIARGEDNWQAAAANPEWQFYTVQPFYGETYTETLEGIGVISDALHDDAQLFIYAAMPFKHQFHDWKDDATTAADDLFQGREAYLDSLAETTGLPIIPCMHVVYVCVEDGVISLDVLYRDHIHASTVLGRNLLGDIAAAYLTDTYPAASPYAKQIWEVLYPGDFNHDKIVNGLDFLFWQAGFGIIYDAEDFLIWQVNYLTPTGRGLSVRRQ